MTLWKPTYITSGVELSDIFSSDNSSIVVLFANDIRIRRIFWEKVVDAERCYREAWKYNYREPDQIKEIHTVHLQDVSRIESNRKTMHFSQLKLYKGFFKLQRFNTGSG
jgi:hypothetical protein